MIWCAEARPGGREMKSPLRIRWTGSRDPDRTLALQDEEHLLVAAVSVVGEGPLARRNNRDVESELPEFDFRSHRRDLALEALPMGPLQERHVFQVDDPRSHRCLRAWLAVRRQTSSTSRSLATAPRSEERRVGKECRSR